MCAAAKGAIARGDEKAIIAIDDIRTGWKQLCKGHVEMVLRKLVEMQKLTWTVLHR